MKQLTTLFLGVAALVVSLIATGVRAQGTFEGVVTYSVTVPMLGDDKLPMITSIKGGNAATVIDMGAMGKQQIYINNQTHTMSIITGKNGFTMPMPAKTNDSADINAIVPTGKKDVINGHAAEEYTATISEGDHQGTMDIWASNDFPADIRSELTHALSDNPQNGGNKVFNALFAKGLAPVRISIATDGTTQATIDFVKFEKKAVDDATMNPPADIKLQPMDPSKMRH